MFIGRKEDQSRYPFEFIPVVNLIVGMLINFFSVFFAKFYVQILKSNVLYVRTVSVIYVKCYDRTVYKVATGKFYVVVIIAISFKTYFAIPAPNGSIEGQTTPATTVASLKISYTKTDDSIVSKTSANTLSRLAGKIYKTGIDETQCVAE